MASLVPYAAAWRLGDLRQRTAGFEVVFFAAFALYAAATVLALREEKLSGPATVGAFALTAAMMGMLLFTRPTLSDDVYRYVWEGRLQAQGISPYVYAPDAPELSALRDTDIWPHINHKPAVTVYPPGAELAFALLWRALPGNVRWFQAAMALGALLAGGLLARLLHDLGRPPARLLIYLWSPLLIFETAHSAHVDGLVLPLLVGAWWARVRERDTATGVLLGLATAVKFYPAILLPALWRPQHRQARWRMPLAFALTLAATYLPYVLTNGPAVLGYLPRYFEMRFNMGLASLLIPVFERAGVDPNQGILALTLVTLALLSAWMVWQPAPNGESALRRCIWLIGAVTLLTQNLFPWYLLWLLPLVAIFLQPGRLLGLRPDAWTGWWLFTGLVGLSYSFFIAWKPVPWAQWAQFVPLYGLLLADAVRRLRPPSTELAA